MDVAKEIREVLDNMRGVLNELDADPTGSDDQYHLREFPCRVMHLRGNPFDRVIQEEEAEYVALEKENERLRARLSLLERGNDIDTMRIDEAVNNAHQIEMLTQQVKEFKDREEKITTSLKKTADRFREACLSLIGYRVDALKDNIYRLSNRNANSDNERLFFEVKRDGTIRLIENDYSRRFSQHVRTYLSGADSFPAFLAALTLDMFKMSSSNTTLNDVDMSVSMNQTVMANPDYTLR